MPAKKKTGNAIDVRMYRQGLGDCFLLKLPGKTKPFWMMIDCGVILGTQEPMPLMAAVVDDIIEATGGVVDVLVATHEHWDHLSGFVQLKDSFGTRLKVKQVWFAWTEDPDNEAADALRAERNRRKKALALSLNALRAAEPDDVADDELPISGQVDSLLSFFGATGGENTTAQAIENLKTFGERRPRFCHPKDQPFGLEEAPGIRIYVLGPPDNETLLKKSNPSRGQVYEKAFQLGMEGSLFGAIDLLTSGALSAQAEELAEIRELCNPFDKGYRVPTDRARSMEFFQKHYWADTIGVAEDSKWRRIEGAWLESAGQLALQLDSDTNNTSLALAIEVMDSGLVLLFPGDAQVGNWLSWHDLKWKIDGKDVTVQDLLARTVLYKVGHHGSHNATLREKGLELMTSQDLIAMIPVDHKMAVKKRWREMPFDPLMERLVQKTKGRVLRTDDEQANSKIEGLVVSEKLISYTDAETGLKAQRPLYYQVSIGAGVPQKTKPASA